MKSLHDHCKGCIGSLIAAMLLWALFLLATSCSSGEILTAQHGTVIHYDAQSVTAQYDTYKKRKRKGIYSYVPQKKKAVNAFYWPSGHSFKIGDVY